MTIGVVIPAGGAGTRMGGVAKPFLPLAGRSVLQHSLALFLARSDVVQIAIALTPSTLAAPPAWLVDPRITLVPGGLERSDSVRAGLSALRPDIELVLVHDAARPLVTADLVERVVRGALQTGSAIAAVPVSDTIHVIADGTITATPDRAVLWQAQTPQAFPRALLLEAHARAQAERVSGTDDAALVRRIGGQVAVVPGAYDNFKITHARDLAIAELVLRSNA